jgi:hypothetical protein
MSVQKKINRFWMYLTKNESLKNNNKNNNITLLVYLLKIITYSLYKNN